MKERVENFIEDKNSIIIFDTNVYLNLYEYSPESTDFFLEVIELIKDKLYVPNTVKREFEKNHKECLYRQNKKFKKVQDILKKPTDQMKDKIRKQFDILRGFKFPGLDELQEEVNYEIRKIEEIFEDYVENHSELDELNTEFLKKDKIKKLINYLVDRNNLLEGFSLDKIYLICEEGEGRYKKNIPPGYKDSKNKSGIQMYNDLIIWKEAIKYCKENGKNLIFVTDDVKEDWYNINNNQRGCFRIELNQEFEKQTGKKMIGLTSYELFSILIEKFNIETTTISECILGNDNDRYINEIIKYDLEGDIINKIVESGDIYVDTLSLSNFDGSYFEVSEDIIDSDFISYEYEGYYEGKAIYYVKYNIKVKAYSNEYGGRDDETKEVILLDTRIHILSGDITVKIERNIDSYMDALIENNSYDEIEIIEGLLSEDENYTEHDLCVECGLNIGKYTNENYEAVCSKCMVVNEAGTICTYCGRKVSYDFMYSDNACRDCAEEYDL